MSIEFLKYDRYGDPEQAKFIIGQVLVCNKSLPYEKIKDKCLKKSAKFGETLPSIIDLLLLVSVLEKDDNKNITLRCDLLDFKKYVADDYRFCSELIKLLLIEMRKLKILDTIFPSEGIEYEKTIAHFTIKDAYIPLPYTGIKKLLIEYGMFEYDTITRTKLIINVAFANLFEDEIIKRIAHTPSEKPVMKKRWTAKRILLYLTIISTAIGIPFAIYKFFKNDNETTAVNNSTLNADENGVNVNGNNNIVTVDQRGNSAQNHPQGTEVQMEEVKSAQTEWKVGQVFRDSITSATLGVNYINVFNQADVVVNLPGQKQLVELAKSPGYAWPFMYKKRKYKLYLSAIHHSRESFSVQVIQIK